MKIRTCMPKKKLEKLGACPLQMHLKKKSKRKYFVQTFFIFFTFNVLVSIR